MCEFDEIFEYSSSDMTVEYGIKTGGETIVFVKAGLGGDARGYDDKYLKMANRLKEKSGYSVICASNPQDGKTHATIDKYAIDRFISEREFSSGRLMFFGNSNGCTKGLEMSCMGVHFEKMVLVNMPLMINFHKVKKWIAESSCKEMILVYGEADPSFPYIPFLKGKYANVKVVTCPGADHNFSGMTEEFVALSDYLSI